MKQKEFFFSIVIPAYNCENTISSTIRSILNQTYQNFELIIVNDGSKDKTQNIIEEHLSNRLKLINIPNSGPGKARNIGIKEASGKYLLLVDADDELNKDSLFIKHQVLKDEEVDLVVGSYITEIWDNDQLMDVKKTKTENMILNNHEEFLQQIYPLMEAQLMYVVWNKIYKLEVIKENNVQFPDYKSCEDRLFNLSFFKNVNTCKISNEIFYKYSFDGKNSLTNRYTENKFESFVQFYKKASKLVMEDKEGFASLFLKGVMSYFVSLHTTSSPLTKQEKSSHIKNALNNNFVKEATEISTTNTLMKKVFKIIFKFNITLFHYFISWLIEKTNHINPQLIEKLKRNY